MVHLPIAYGLWFISGFGVLGLHRHYLRKHPTGILWLLTGGLGMVGSVYDLVTMPRQCREYNERLGLDGMGSREDWPQPLAPAGGSDGFETAILKLAQNKKGLVTLPEAALASGLPLEETRRRLEDLAKKGFCILRVTGAGALVFQFTEFSGSNSADLI